MSYRLVIGERGNEVGHMLPCAARSLRGARRSLMRALQPYGEDGWGAIWLQCPQEGVPPHGWYLLARYNSTAGNRLNRWH